MKKIKDYILERSKKMSSKQREHIQALSIKYKIEDGLIKNYAKLTQGQKRILERMLKTEEELVWCKGGGWWIGEHQTNGRLAMSLIRACVISQMTSSHLCQIYTINETGRIALESGYLIGLK